MLFKCVFSNPYYNQTLPGFFLQLIKRLIAFFSGNLSFNQLASDEVQVFVLIGIAISTALIGCFLVLRRMTMLANSLSHTILIGIVLAYVVTIGAAKEGGIPPMQAMIVASLLTGFLTTFLTEFLTKIGRLQEDASTGPVFTTLFALGVILVTILSRDAHIGTEAVMGNVDALYYKDMIWVYAITLLNCILITLFYKEFLITTFDPGFAKAIGISPFLFNYLLMAQVSATTITSFRAVGVLLVLAFITAPALSARLLTHRLLPLLFWAVGFGAFSALMGVALARHLLTVYGIALSTSGLVVCLLFICYLLTLLLTSFFKRIGQRLTSSDALKN